MTANFSDHGQTGNFDSKVQSAKIGHPLAITGTILCIPNHQVKETRLSNRLLRHISLIVSELDVLSKEI